MMGSRRALRLVLVALAVAITFVSTPGAPAPAAEAARAPRRITMAFTGDFLATHATWVTAHRYAGGDGYDFTPMLDPLRSYIRSVDVGICHLETPLTGPGMPLSDFPRYVVPHQLANAIHRVGYDGCSTASNHSLDGGLRGIRTTLGWLDKVGLRHTGTARSAAERWRTTHYRVGSVLIAHLSYSASFNGIQPAYAWEANRIDPARIIADAKRARSRGAKIVVVSLHWGSEHRHAPTAYQTSIARRLMSSGKIDLIVGHHAHVIQPVRRVAGHWVAYGLGNSLSGMTASMFTPSVQDGMVLFAVFERGPHGWHVEMLRYAPTWVQPYRWIVRRVGPALDAGTLPDSVLAELRKSWHRTVAAVDAQDLGVIAIRRPKL